MNATAYLNDFIRRHGCTVNVVTGREFTSMGNRVDSGQSCADCGQCNREHGSVGMAAEGVALQADIDGSLHLQWLCPGCGRETTEETSLLRSTAHAAEAMKDPLCFSCRKKHEESSMTRGGPNRGQGRKPLQEGVETVTVSIRMTPEQREQLAELGGGEWIRGQIDRAAKLQRKRERNSKKEAK